MLKIHLKYARAALLTVIALFLGACGHYPAINVKVVDAETSEPIEGAVLLSQWTVTSGIGHSATHNYKVVEALSNSEGKIKLTGVSKPGVNRPKITVYKKGYVAWNNKFIFPGYVERKDFSWRNGFVFRLERFKPEYTHRDHIKFIRGSYSSGVGFGPLEQAIRWEALRKNDE